ncbi:hypothetical protein, partial [Sulfitobacter sp.]|uniref:hypothetical protein n=1 Tax=Sulfitobacter sp. TaxID=1903071 RepID=UPI0030034714
CILAKPQNCPKKQDHFTSKATVLTDSSLKSHLLSIDITGNMRLWDGVLLYLAIFQHELRDSVRLSFH